MFCFIKSYGTAGYGRTASIRCYQGVTLFNDSSIANEIFTRLSRFEEISAVGFDDFHSRIKKCLYFSSSMELMFINGKLITDEGLFDIYENGYGHVTFIHERTNLEFKTPFQHYIYCDKDTKTMLTSSLEQQTADIIRAEQLNLNRINALYETVGTDNSGIIKHLPEIIFSSPTLCEVFDQLIQGEDYNIHCFNSNGAYSLLIPPLYEAAISANDGKTAFAKQCDRIEVGISIYATTELHGLIEYLSYPIFGRFKYENKLLWNSSAIKDEPTKKAAMDIYAYLDFVMELNKLFLEYFDEEIAYFKTYSCFITLLEKLDFNYFPEALKEIKSKRKRDALLEGYKAFKDFTFRAKNECAGDVAFLAYRAIVGLNNGEK